MGTSGVHCDPARRRCATTRATVVSPWNTCAGPGNTPWPGSDGTPEGERVGQRSGRGEGPWATRIRAALARAGLVRAALARRDTAASGAC